METRERVGNCRLREWHGCWGDLRGMLERSEMQHQLLCQSKQKLENSHDHVLMFI